MARKIKARKMNLTVPEDLYEKIQEWRSKSKINFSGIFQKAAVEIIEEREQFYKRYKKGGKKMGQIIERLKEEKIEVEGNPSLEGRQEGLDWAEAAHYSDLKEVVESDDLPTHDEHFSDYFHTVTSENENLSSDDWRYENYNSYTYKFWEAWKRAVVEFWDLIKDQI